MEEDYIRAYGQGSATIQQVSYTIDGTGTRTPTWNQYKVMKAWLQPTSSGLRLEYERRNITVTAKIFVAEDPAAEEGWRVVMPDSKTYVIRGIVDQAGLGRLWRLDVEELR